MQGEAKCRARQQRRRRAEAKWSTSGKVPELALWFDSGTVALGAKGQLWHFAPIAAPTAARIAARIAPPIAALRAAPTAGPIVVTSTAPRLLPRYDQCPVALWSPRQRANPPARRGSLSNRPLLLALKLLECAVAGLRRQELRTVQRESFVFRGQRGTGYRAR